MNRRNFFAFLPLAPVAAVGAAVKAEAVSMAPENPIPSLTLTGSKKLPPPPPPVPRVGNNVLSQNGWITFQDMHSGNVSFPAVGMKFNGPDKEYELDNENQVHISVGKDGNLWIKNGDGVWKRIITE